jgi:hypothetical protein
MLQGLWTVTACPAFSLYLASHGRSQAYCTLSDENQHSWQYHGLQLVVILLGSDLKYEWYYHRMGHV